MSLFRRSPYIKLKKNTLLILKPIISPSTLALLSYPLSKNRRTKKQLWELQTSNNFVIRFIGYKSIDPSFRMNRNLHRENLISNWMDSKIFHVQFQPWYPTERIYKSTNHYVRRNGFQLNQSLYPPESSQNSINHNIQLNGNLIKSNLNINLDIFLDICGYKSQWNSVLSLFQIKRILNSTYPGTWINTKSNQF